jgi:hypothetical protein
MAAVQPRTEAPWRVQTPRRRAGIAEFAAKCAAPPLYVRAQRLH